MSHTLQGIDTEHLGRQAVEQFFRVSERCASQILAGLDALQADNASRYAGLQAPGKPRNTFPLTHGAIFATMPYEKPRYPFDLVDQGGP